MSPSDRPRNQPRKLTSDRAHLPPFSWSPCDVELPQITLANSSGSLLPLTKGEENTDGIESRSESSRGLESSLRTPPLPVPSAVSMEFAFSL